MSLVVLLGPQRDHPTVLDTLDRLGVDGQLAVVTAGWQEREQEVDELQEHVGRELVNLRLYERFDAVMGRDPALADALRRRQETLQQLQQLYRQRLSHALDAAREMLALPHDDAVRAHRRESIRALRTLDRQHVVRLRKIHREFEEQWQPSGRPAVKEHRDELAELLSRSAALAVAGGHVAVLINRLRLFDLFPMLDDQPVVAWSAGAMVLAERVVLFHDSPPQGPGNAEVFEAGRGLYPGVVPLPHAAHRIRLDDPTRVALFARRFSPAKCVLLEDRTRLIWNGERWDLSRGTRRLTRRGGVGVTRAA